MTGHRAGSNDYSSFTGCLMEVNWCLGSFYHFLICSDSCSAHIWNKKSQEQDIKLKYPTISRNSCNTSKTKLHINVRNNSNSSSSSKSCSSSNQNMLCVLFLRAGRELPCILKSCHHTWAWPCCVLQFLRKHGRLLKCETHDMESNMHNFCI